MSIRTDRQRRTISNDEIATDESLSVRIVQHMADNLNNYYFRAGNHKVWQDIWSNAASPVDNQGTAADVMVLPPLGPCYIPEGFLTLRYWLTSERTSGSDAMNWKIWVCGGLYQDNFQVDTTKIESYTTETIEIDANVPTRETGTIDIRNILSYSRTVWILITGDDPASSTFRLLALDLQPSM